MAGRNSGQPTRLRHRLRMARCRSGVALPHATISASVRPQPRHTPASTVQTPVQGEGTAGSIVVGMDGWTFISRHGMFDLARDSVDQVLTGSSRQKMSIGKQHRANVSGRKFGELPLLLPVSTVRLLDISYYNGEGGEGHIPEPARLLIRQIA